MTVPHLTDENFKTELGVKLFHKLKSIYDEDHFLFCVLSRLETDEQKAQLLDVIESGITDDEQITLYSVIIKRGLINQYKRY